MSTLLRHPAATNPVHAITPENAGWTYVGFELHDLAPGAAISAETGGREVCIVIVTGKARIAVGKEDFGTLGARTDVFEGSPWSVYAPAKATYSVTAETACEIAICSAPARGDKPARLITPDEVGQETRGQGTNTRYVRNILPDTSPIAESLLVVEVITPGGNWSSYPPHKHDTDDFPNETYLEETYYHRLKRGSGFGFQRVYTDDGSLDETMAFGHRDVVLVPKGYHPVGAPHGFDLYYLNVMAGPRRAWKFSFPKDHAFLTW
ncbi:MAG: 5-deoxy-glucuronate isomerase [Proteobacteria bacterium]|nr:5-deoxy-glucuronate isomerase [Pseudomonadota bacterium]